MIIESWYNLINSKDIENHNMAPGTKQHFTKENKCVYLYNQ